VYNFYMNKGSTVIIALLLIVIALLVWLLIVKQAEAPTVPSTGTTTQTGTTGVVSPNPTPTTPPASGPTPLHQKIVVTFPKANASVPKKFTVTGKAPGNWFFEASAPIMVQAEDGSKIAQGQMQALDDWMTTDLVNFKAELTVNAAYSGPATLVLMKDNPSGLPENDDSLEIPITIQ
jgi:hypothetical protein